MQKIQVFLSMILIFFLCTASNCTKTDTPPIEQIPVAGRGGNITIVAFPEHHGMPIINHANYADTAFIKYNTQEYPGAASKFYDTMYVGETAENHVHLKGLKKGNYYIYMVGYDSTINQRVYGGIPVSYKLFTADAGELDLHVPVTE